MVIYRTDSWKGYGKHNYYWREYRLENDTIYIYKCNKVKTFDGDENVWHFSEELEEEWRLDNPNIPKRLLDRAKKFY